MQPSIIILLPQTTCKGSANVILLGLEFMFSSASQIILSFCACSPLQYLHTATILFKTLHFFQCLQTEEIPIPLWTKHTFLFSNTNHCPSYRCSPLFPYLSHKKTGMELGWYGTSRLGKTHFHLFELAMAACWWYTTDLLRSQQGLKMASQDPFSLIS